MTYSITVALLRSRSWSCRANAIIRLKSQKDDVDDYEITISHLFNPLENEWGCEYFLPLQVQYAFKLYQLCFTGCFIYIFVSDDFVSRKWLHKR